MVCTLYTLVAIATQVCIGRLVVNIDTAGCYDSSLINLVLLPSIAVRFDDIKRVLATGVL